MPRSPASKERLAAIVAQRCPRCLRGRVFPRGWRQLRMYFACPACGLVFGREEGYFTGAMIVSYVLAVPLVALLVVIILLVTGWRFDVVVLVAALYFLPFVPAVFRYSRVIWMHFDRMVDPTQESERYLPPQQPIPRRHDDGDDAQHRTDPAA